MKFLLIILAISITIQAKECTYNNVNKLGGKHGDSLLLLGQYGENPNRCAENRTISSKYIESFSINNQTNELKLYMVSGEVFSLIELPLAFHHLVEIKNNNQ